MELPLVLSGMFIYMPLLSLHPPPLPSNDQNTVLLSKCICLINAKWFT